MALSTFKGIIMLIIAFESCNSLETIVVDNPDDSQQSLWSEFLLSEILTTFNFSVEWHRCNFSSILSCISQYPNSLILLDFSKDLLIQNSLSQICQNYFLIHLVYQNNFRYFEKWSYSLTSSFSDYLSAFYSLLRYFNWSQGAVFLNEDSQEFKNEISKYLSELDYYTIAPMTDTNDLTNGVVARTGSTLYYLFTSTFQSKKLHISLKNAKLLTSGSAVILNQESGYHCNIEGALIITEKGHEYDDSSQEYLKSTIIEIISLVLEAENSKDIKVLLDSKLPKHYPSPEFSIVNIQNGQRVIVGSMTNENLVISGKITFLGNSSDIPKSNKKNLPISINPGFTNPGGVDPDSGGIDSLGAFDSIDTINEGHDILHNFHISVFNFDCGSTVYDEIYLKSCYNKDISHLGLAHLMPGGSSVAIGTYNFFQNSNIEIPTIGSANGSPLLSSIAKFPMYVRLITPFSLHINIIFLRAMGWKNAAIIYESSIWGISSYNSTKISAESLGVKLLNSENLRSMPANLDREHIKASKSALEGVINSKARLLIILIQCPMCNYVLEYLYDLGLRKGDLYVFTGTFNPMDAISNNDTYAYKRLEIGVSMTRIILPNWEGEIGQSALKRILKKNNTVTDFTCTYYDSAYIIAKALDYMINRGQDYTDPDKLISIIRQTKFVGCTGPVSINPDSNDRIFDIYPIETLKVDNKGNTEIYWVGNLKPFSTKILSIVNPLIYADGTSIKPSDIRDLNSKCPFPDREVHTFAKGRELVFGLCFFVFIVTSVITFFIWHRWWNVPTHIFEEKQEISIGDLIVAVTIPIEFFQFATMGPKFSALSSILYDLCSLSNIELDDVINMTNGMFWFVVDAVFVCIGLWGILCAVVLLKLSERWEDSWILRNLDWAAENLMPVLGNLCFMPFISICLDIFVCDESIGDNFTDSFAIKDCHVFCWKDNHLVYAIISFIAILVYEPLAVYHRPLWQFLQPSLHVETVPGYLMVKSVAQTLLVVLAKTLKRSNDISHGVVFIVVMMIYIAIVSKIKSYNYGRFNLWQFLSLIGVVWLALISTFYIGTAINPIAYLVFLCIGWLVLSLLGLYLQFKKYPSLLYRKQSKNLHGLFRFAFTFKSSIYLMDD